MRRNHFSAHSTPTDRVSSDVSPREPQILRFRLRQLFVFVTCISVFCATLVTTEGPWPLVIALSAVLVAAHVFGTLVGTRLRDTSDQVRRWKAVKHGADHDQPQATEQPVSLAEIELPPETPLADFGRVSSWGFWLVPAGALVGAIVGATVIATTMWHRIGWPGFIVGTISAAVLGTWAAFLASSFGTIAHHAWRHAHEHDKK